MTPTVKKSGEGIVRDHFRLLDIIQETPRTWGEIAKETGWRDNTLSNRLNLLKDLKKIKQLPDGRYASIDFEDVDEKIISLIKKHKVHEKSSDLFSTSAEQCWKELKPGLLMDITDHGEEELKNRFFRQVSKMISLREKQIEQLRIKSSLTND